MKTKIQKQPIHGEGLFAAEDIPSGAQIIPVFKKNGNEPVLNKTARKINHSDNPNAMAQIVMENVLLIATKPIAQGEEITVDYGQWNNDMPVQYQTKDFRKEEARAQNARAGLTGEKYENHRADFDFFSQGIPFSGIQPKSAKNLLGNQWKKIMIAALGEKKFIEKASKYGNKPYDIEIAGVHTDKSKWFNPGETVRINATNEDLKVVYRSPNFIALAKEYDGDASGIIYNISRLNGAKKAMEKFSQYAEGIKTEATPAGAAQGILPGECPTNGPECAKHPSKDFKPVSALTRQQKVNKAGKLIFGLSAAALLIYSIYGYIQQKKQL